MHAPTITSVPAARRLVLGNADLAQQLGVSPDDRQALLGARSQPVLASAYADLPDPLDGVTLSTTDADLCTFETRSKRSGREPGTNSHVVASSTCTAPHSYATRGDRRRSIGGIQRSLSAVRHGG